MPPFRAFALLSLLVAQASAQCFEPALGAPCAGGNPSAGFGDDLLFALQPLADGLGGGIASFPIGGVAGTYTHAHISANGVLFLTNGAPSGATVTGYSTSPTVIATNLRGFAGQPPRIAPYWRDLDNLPGNGGGVFCNNTIPGKFVVTWQNTVHYAQTAPVFTVQAQLFGNGRVVFFYDGAAQNTAICPLVGVSAGNGIADHGPSDLLQGAASTTPLLYQTFPALHTFPFAGRSLTFVPNAAGGYDETSSACLPAGHTGYGAGCYDLALAAVYEHFPSASAFDLANTSLVFTPTGNGYTLAPGSATLLTHVAPTVLTLGDDDEATLPLAAALPYPGGNAAALTVCSNGFVSVAPGNGTAALPDPLAFLAAPQAAWWTWHDFDPTAAGSGAVLFEELGGVACVTWDGVYDHGGTGAADASTIQYQFDEATGNVSLVFGTVATTGSGFLVGWSPGGPVRDPGSIDLTTALPRTTGPDRSALTLAVTPNPVLGSTLTYTTSNIPTGQLVSGLMLSLGGVDPGLDLGFMGAPGCLQSVDLASAATYLMFQAPTDTVQLPIPNNWRLAGVRLHAQAAALVPGVNALGLLTSNAFQSTLNAF